MKVNIPHLLNKLDQRINRFIEEDGVLDSATSEDILQKAINMRDLAQEIQSNSELLQFDKVTEFFERIVVLIELGDLLFETKEQIAEYYKKIRIYIKGMKLSVEVAELASDEDLPESVYEAYEPSIDPETGECEEPMDLSFYSDVLSLYPLHKANSAKAEEFSEAVDSLISQMATLSFKINEEFQVDLGEGLKGVANPRRALYDELKAMRKATEHYFEPTHLASTAEVARVAQEFYEKNSVSTDLCAGSLVIAAAEALRSVYLLNDQLVDHEAKIDWQGVPLSIQRKPSEKNLGNLLIRNVGCYGHREITKKAKWNILDDFKEVEKYSGEACLKEVMAQYGACPAKITCEMLNLHKAPHGKDILKKFKQNLFLIFCAEIFRYFPVEEKPKSDVKQLPFAIALSLGLEMLCSGDIELKDLFDHDADLGLPTGSKILDSKNKLYEKFKNLLARYQEYLEDSYPMICQFKRVFPQGRVVSSKKLHTERLQNCFGNHLRP